MELQKSNSRIVWIDLAKGLAIFLVVVGHIYSGGIFQTWLYSFHIPLFFIVSGCLMSYKNKDNKKLSMIIIGSIKNLMVPYVTFSILTIAMRLAFSNFSITIFKQDLRATIVLHGVWTLWFLSTLFIAEILFYVIRRSFNKDYIRIIVTIVLFFSSLMLSGHSNSILIGIFRSFIALGFVSIGYYTFKSINKIDLPYYSIFILIVANIILSQYNGKVDLDLLSFNNLFLYTLNSILGSMAIMLLLKKLKNIKLLTYWGSNSLIIMCTHIYILEFAIMVTGSTFAGYINENILIVVIMMLEYPIITVINRFMPFMLGKRYSKKARKSNDMSITD